MANLQESFGIVLSKRKYKERDFLVKILLEDYGKMMFYVRGSKNPNFPLKNVIQPFTQAVFIVDVKERGLSFLRDAKQVEPNRSLQIDIFKNAYSTYICGLIDASMQDKIPMPTLYKQLSIGLEKINQDYDAAIIMNVFEIKLLHNFGVMPELQQCVVCGKKNGIFDYSSKHHGILCQNHFYEDERRLHASPRAIHLIRKFSLVNLNQLESISVKDQTKSEIRYVIDTIYDELVGVHLKSKSFIEQMNKWKNLIEEDS